MTEVKIGGTARELVRIAVTARARPQDQDYWDGNWLTTEVEVVAGGFKGRARCSLRAEDFVGFRDQVATLAKSFDAVASFTTMEGWLTLTLRGDRAGRIKVDGDLLDEPGVGNRLSFHLEIDQSYLGDLVAQLNKVVSEFPVRGVRDA